MADGFSIRMTVDEVTPAVTKLQKVLTNLTPVLESIGVQIVDITKRAFFEESLRAAPWAPKRDGSPATLIKSRELINSITVTGVTATSVTVGSNKIYAAAQQLGATIKAKPGKMLVFMAGGVKVFAKKVVLPPRPFFPITSDGELTPTAREKITQTIEDALGIYAS